MPFMPPMTKEEGELVASVEQELTKKLPNNQLLMSLSITAPWPLDEQCQRELEDIAAETEFELEPPKPQEDHEGKAFVRIKFTNKRKPL